MSGVHEVTAFLGSIGLDVCVQAVVHNGFYTSMEALKGATYEELLDCGVRPMHAKLLLSNLGVKGGATGLGAAAPAPEASGAEEVASFLRSVGLEQADVLEQLATALRLQGKKRQAREARRRAEELALRAAESQRNRPDVSRSKG